MAYLGFLENGKQYIVVSKGPVNILFIVTVILKQLGYTWPLATGP